MTNSISNKPQRASGTQQRIVLLYEDAAIKASVWQKALRHAEREAGRLMREERERRGISLRKMAELLHVSPPHLSDMENGNRRYSPAWVTEAMAVFEQNKEMFEKEKSKEHKEEMRKMFEAGMKAQRWTSFESRSYPSSALH